MKDENVLGIKATVNGKDIVQGADEFIAQIKRMENATDELLDKLGSNAKMMKGEVQGMGKSFDDVLSAIKKGAAAIGLGFSLQKLVSDIVRVRGEIESLQKSFDILAGAEGGELFEEIKEFATKTPMDMPELAKGAQTLMAFNIEASEVMPILRAMGDVSMGNKDKFQSLILAFSQMRSSGKLMGQDLMQMINAGFNPLSVISEQTGKSVGQLKEEMSSGAISAEMVTKAFMDATAEGGKFHGMLQTMSSGIEGMKSNLEGAFSDMLNEIGENTQGLITGTLSVLTKIVENYKKVGEAIGLLVTAYGSYKAAQMIGITYQKIEMKVLKEAAALRIAAANSQTALSKAEALAAAKTNVLTNATKQLTKALKAKSVAMMSNPYVLAAIAVTGLVAGIYKLATAKSAEERAIERVNALRKEAQEKREEERATIDKLLNTINDENQTKTAQIRAYEELKGIMPEYTAALSLEEMQAKGTAEQQKTLNELYEKANYSKLTSDVAAYASALEEVKRVGITGASQAAKDLVKAADLKVMNNKNSIAFLEKALEDAQKQLKIFEEARYKALSIEAKIELAENAQQQAQDAYNEALEAFEKAKNERKGMESNFMSLSDAQWENILPQEVVDRLKAAEQALAGANKTLNDLNDTLSQDASKGNYGEAYAKAQKKWEDADKALQDAMTNRGNYTVEQYKALVEAEKTAADEFKALGGNAKAKEKEKVKEQKEIDKDRVKLAKQTARELESIRGSELDKELEDIRANYEDKIEEINKLEKEWRKAQGGKLKSDQESTLANARSGAQAIRDSQEANARLEYQREIDDIMLSLKRETADNWLALDEDEHKQRMISIQRDYEDRMSAIEESERQLREKEGGTLTDEQTKEFDAARSSAQARRNHEEQQANKDALDNILSEIITYNQKRQQVEEEYAKKRKELYLEDGVTLREGVTEANVANFDENRDKALQAVDEEFASKSESYQAWMDTIADMSLKQLGNALEQAKAELATIEADGTSSEQDVAIARAKVNALEGQIKSLQAKTGVGRRSIDEWKDLTDVLGEASSEFEQLGEEIGGVAGELLNSIGTIASTTVSMINNIVQLVEVSSQGTQQTASTAAAAIRAVETASVILAIISAAVQIIRKIVEMATKMHDGKYDKVIEANQEKVDSLEKSYENLEEAIDKAFGQKAVQTLKEMNANLEQQNRLINEQAEAEAEKKKAEEETIQSYRDKIEENQKQMAENQKAMEEAIFGNDIKSAIEGFADAYADAVANNMHLNESAAEQAKSAMKDMVQESIKEYIAGTGRMEKIRAKMKALYADGVFSEEDQRLIKAEYERLNNELDAKFAWAEDLLTDTESSSSEGSTSRGIATASQESVDENNGRLMSIQVSMEMLRQDLTQQSVLQSLISADTASIREAMTRQNQYISEIVDIQYESVGYLQGIKKNTDLLHSINDRLGVIESNTRNL